MFVNDNKVEMYQSAKTNQSPVTKQSSQDCCSLTVFNTEFNFGCCAALLSLRLSLLCKDLSLTTLSSILTMTFDVLLQCMYVTRVCDWYSRGHSFYCTDQDSYGGGRWLSHVFRRRSILLKFRALLHQRRFHEC